MNFNNNYKEAFDEAAAWAMTQTDANTIIQAAGNTSRNESLAGSIKVRRFPRLKKPAAVILAAALVLAIGVTVFAAGGVNLTRAFLGIFRSDIRIQERLESLGMVTTFDDSYSVTADGITVKPTVLLTDGTDFYLGFKFFGYDTGEEFRPEFVTQPDIEVSGTTGLSASMGFYSEVMETELDGKEVDYEHTISTGNYYDKDGSLEYIFRVSPESDNECWGENIHVEFRDISTYVNTQVNEGTYWAEDTIEGPWIFDIAIPEENTADEQCIRTTQPEDACELWEGVSITGIKITPLGIYVTQTRPADVYEEGEPDHPKWDNYVEVVGFSLKSGEYIDYIPGRVIDPDIIKNIDTLFVTENDWKGTGAAHSEVIEVKIK